MPGRNEEARIAALVGAVAGIGLLARSLFSRLCPTSSAKTKKAPRHDFRNSRK